VWPVGERKYDRPHSGPVQSCLGRVAPAAVCRGFFHYFLAAAMRFTSSDDRRLAFFVVRSPVVDVDPLPEPR